MIIEGVRVITTYYCNLNCRFCYQPGRGSTTQLSEGNLAKALDSLERPPIYFTVQGGEVVIIECSKKAYKNNLILDNLWYRFIADRRDIFISKFWRDYIDVFSNQGFSLRRVIKGNIKDIVLLRRCDD